VAKLRVSMLEPMQPERWLIREEKQVLHGTYACVRVGMWACVRLMHDYDLGKWP
jgi:hypothetical protein